MNGYHGLEVLSASGNLLVNTSGSWHRPWVNCSLWLTKCCLRLSKNSVVEIGLYFSVVLRELWPLSSPHRWCVTFFLRSRRLCTVFPPRSLVRDELKRTRPPFHVREFLLPFFSPIFVVRLAFFQVHHEGLQGFVHRRRDVLRLLQDEARRWGRLWSLRQGNHWNNRA